ncbi:ATP-binding protein [Teredinibacter sp. KSP-S5-2]|uniref:ATP-binding protein n=1 Tax=Teredinibacter sp. KSP-S5-2 TaxID=3034506 RepID=UPI0029349588|nr:ATP-binding protein [Teredinibacter sp. KSP-S5-2]WNO10516.1 ATP-binding protein [Teredinibacter sp. KSP-S5-2]
MGFPIVTADQRKKEKSGIKGLILGEAGIGKTSLLWTIPENTTLFLDLEAGDLAVEGWEGDALRPKTWQECRDYAVYIGGPNPAHRPDQAYSQAHYDAVCEKFGDAKKLNKYDTFFIDSISVAGRFCLQWCKGQPQAISEKTGKLDMRGAYGLLGQEMIGWITHLQHTRNKNIWLLGILQERSDDYGRRIFEAQIDGSKTGLELPGILDQVVTMVDVPDVSGNSTRVFINHKINPMRYPAKDRSGRLDLQEPAHLGKLMQKIKGPVKSALERLEYGDPPPQAMTPINEPSTAVRTATNTGGQS